MYTCNTYMVRNTKHEIRKDLAHVLGEIQGRLMDGEIAMVQVSLEEAGSSHILMDVYANEEAPQGEGRLLSNKWEMGKHTERTMLAWHMVKESMGI